MLEQLLNVVILKLLTGAMDLLSGRRHHKKNTDYTKPIMTISIEVKIRQQKKFDIVNLLLETCTRTVRH